MDERRGRGDRGNANLDPAHELDVPANREFYKHNDVRPPYTYAALIRYVRLIYRAYTYLQCIPVPNGLISQAYFFPIFWIPRGTKDLGTIEFLNNFLEFCAKF